MNFCGHATLATAYVLAHCLSLGFDSYIFHTKSGQLTVDILGDKLAHTMPCYRNQAAEVVPEIQQGLGAHINIKECQLSDDYLVVLEMKGWLDR